MEYREMKKIGVSPSLLGFGCMHFPTMDVDGKMSLSAKKHQRCLILLLKQA